MILNTPVSLFASHLDTEPLGHPPLRAILAALRAPKPFVVDTIAKCRAEPDKAARRGIKASLPVVCFSAVLNHRRSGKHADKERARTGIVCLDFDGVWSPEETRSALAKDSHVLAYFESPSGDGLKVLCRVDGPMEGAWHAMRDYFLATHDIAADEARKDVHGLCYASHDPAAWVAPDPDAVIPFAAVERSAETPRAAGGERLPDFAEPLLANGPLQMINPDCPYAQWIEIGQALHCQFAGATEGLILWDGWSKHGAKYPGIAELEKHYRSFNGSGMTFRTVIKYAQDAGWSMPGKPRAKATAPSGSDDGLTNLIASELNGTYSLVSWPFPVITEKSRSLLPGSVTVICGTPGSAKSWWVISCLSYWIESSVNAAVLMLEESNAWHMKRLLAQLSGNVNLLDSSWCRSHPDIVLQAHDRHRAAVGRASKRLWCEGNLTMAACAEWVEARCAEGCRVLIIDPITFADPGSEKPWDADRRFLARIKVAIEAAGVSLVLVTHPRKVSGKPTAPTMDDMAGGAAYARAAASVLWLQGVDGRVETQVDDADGRKQTVVTHKIIRIMKARNAAGQHEDICYKFRDLSFIEEGKAVKQPPSPPPSDRPTRAARISSKPTTGEDPFR